MRNNTLNTKEEELLFSVLKTRELESKYSHVSCFEAEDAYQKLQEGHNKSLQLINEISKGTHIDKEAIFKIYEDIAKDTVSVYDLDADQVIDGILMNVIDFKVMRFNEFLMKYVTPQGKEELVSQYHKESDPVEFLKLNYLCDLDIYYTDTLDYLILFELEEDKLHTLKDAA